MIRLAHSRYSDLLKWLGVFSVLLAVLGVVGVVCRGLGLELSFDSASLFSPYFTLVADFARSGQILLWNPWSNCGSPDAAYVEMGSFSPLTLATAWITGGGEDGFLIYWLTIWALGGTGLLVLGRSLDAPGWTTLAVTIGFLFSGFYVGTATHISWLYAFSFLPWMIWRLDRSLTSRRWGPSLEAGALYGLAALAGHPALIVLNGLYLAGWTFGRCIVGHYADRDPSVDKIATDEPHRDRPAGSEETVLHASGLWTGLVRVTLHLTLVVAVALVVLSPAYGIFFMEGAGYSDRTGYLPRQIAVADQALPVDAIATVTSPYLPVLKAFNPQLWSDVFVGLIYNYLGAVIPALALLALSRHWRNGWYWWLVLMTALWLACAVGPALPIRGWLYDLCPPTRYFRHTSVFRGYALFSLAMLALYGGRELAAKQPRDWAACCASGSLLFVVALAGYGLTLSQVADAGPGIMFAHFQFLMAWLGLPLLALAAWNQGTEFASKFAPVLLVLLAIFDAALTCGISGSLMLKQRRPPSESHRVTTLDLKSTGLDRDRYSSGGLPVNDNLYDKRPMLENFNTLNSRFHTREGLGTADWVALSTSWCDEEILAASVMGNAGRVWFAERVPEVSPTSNNFLAFVDRTRSLGAMPLVRHKPAELLDPPSDGEGVARQANDEAAIHKAPAATRVEIQLDRYTPNELAFQVVCPDDGWIMVADRWARGWRVQVNGRDTTPWVGNFVFRAVPVQQGSQSIEFQYRPFGHPWLAVLSWSTMFLILASAFYRWTRDTVAEQRG